MADVVPDLIPVTPLLAISRRDPYPGFAKLRAMSPVFLTPHGLAVITGHAAATAALKDPRLERFSVFELSSRGLPPEPRRDRVAALSGATVLFQNPPDHGRLRAFMSRAFQPKIIEDLRGRLEALVAKLLDAAAARGRFDFVADFAQAFPVQVIAELIGVPKKDWRACIDWSNTLAPTIDAVIPRERMDRAIDVTHAFADYLGRLFAARRAKPAKDLVTKLVGAHDGGAELSEDELVSNVITLFVAGHETTTGLLGNALVELHKDPALARRLAREPERIGPFVEEVLRFESPIQLSARIAKEDLTIDGVFVPRGATAWVFLGAANRDPSRFDAPDTFDAARDPNPHLAFGSGPHFCLGAPLARMEAEVALRQFLTRFPRWKLVEPELALRPTMTLRSYQRLTVETA
jgi:cytochrome P450